MKLPTRQAVLFTFAGSLMLSAGATAVRANDPCIANGPTLLCQGDQTDGLDLTNTAFDTLVVQSLTRGIATSGVPGIIFVTTDGGPLRLRSDTSPFGISTTDDDAPGILVTSLAVLTDTASNLTGGGVSISSADTIATTGDGSFGIAAGSIFSLSHSGLSLTGQGGDVVVSSMGTIATQGEMSSGIDVANGLSVSSTLAGGHAHATGGSVAIGSRSIQASGADSPGIRVFDVVTSDADFEAIAQGGGISVENSGRSRRRASFRPVSIS